MQTYHEQSGAHAEGSVGVNHRPGGSVRTMRFGTERERFPGFTEDDVPSRASVAVGPDRPECPNASEPSNTGLIHPTGNPDPNTTLVERADSFLELLAIYLEACDGLDATEEGGGDPAAMKDSRTQTRNSRRECLSELDALISTPAATAEGARLKRRAFRAYLDGLGDDNTIAARLARSALDDLDRLDPNLSASRHPFDKGNSFP